MRTPKAGTTMGKCTFCKDYIIQGDSNRAKHATVIEAFMDYQQEAQDEKEELLKKVGEYGWSVNPVTGKLQKL